MQEVYCLPHSKCSLIQSWPGGTPSSPEGGREVAEVSHPVLMGGTPQSWLDGVPPVRKDGSMVLSTPPPPQGPDGGALPIGRWGYPPGVNWHTTENITFPHPSDAGR